MGESGVKRAVLAYNQAINLSFMKSRGLGTGPAAGR